jgi:hypothetical protein
MSRLLREGGFVQKGARGKNAPHLSSRDLAHFLIAYLACPDSPTLAVERLPHFAALPYAQDGMAGVTFADALARLLDRLSKETWAEANACRWEVRIRVNYSYAAIMEAHGENEVVHPFSSLHASPPERDMRDYLPYAGGLNQTHELTAFTLYRIARVILGNVADPMDEILEGWRAEREAVDA